jgi:PAS domain S-box-containing protein
VNQAAVELFQAPSVDEIIGRSIMDFVHPDDRARVAERVRTMIGTGSAVPRIEERFMRLDGQELYGEVAASPFTYDGGSAILVVIRDVTERHRAEMERSRSLSDELALRLAAEEAQRRLALLAQAGKVLSGSLDYETTLQQAAHLAVPEIADWCVIDVIEEDGSIRRVALAHADPEKERWAQEIHRRYPPDERSTAYVLQAAGHSLLMPEITEETVRAVARDDEHFEILRMVGMESTMAVALQSRGTLFGSITFISTNPARRYSEADLSVAEELAQHMSLAIENSRLYSETRRVAAEREAMLSQLAEGLAIADASGRVTYVNAASLRMTGTFYKDMPLDDVVVPFQIATAEGEPYPPEQLPLARALRGETVEDSIWRLRRSDGREVVMAGSAAPVRDDQGNLLGAVSTYRDVTEQVEVERQKNEFLSLIAHEIRTPVTVIQGFVQLMERYYGADAGPLQKHLGAVTRQVKQISALVNDLLALSRLERGALTAELRPIDLAESVRAAADEMRILHARHEIAVDAPENAAILGDSARLHQVLMNLLDNALTYGPADEPVTITLRESGTDWVCKVSDAGPAIPTEQRERLFERFYRMPAHQRARPNGLGIGLYISRAIVEAHGGRMWIPDEDHAAFSFSIPSHVP